MKTMGKMIGILLLITVCAVIIVDLSSGQSGAIFRQIFRSVVIKDSLRVSGATTVNGNLAVSGTVTSNANVSSDSVASRWIVRDSLHVYKTSIHGGDATFSSTITGTTKIRGQDAFTTSATLDTVVITGLLSTDFPLVSVYKQGTPGTAEFLSAFPGANGDTLFVARNTGTTSGLKYVYFILR